MRIFTVNGDKNVSVGASSTLFSVYSTAFVRLEKFKKKVPMAISFLETGSCSAEDAEETARQLNMIRDKLAAIPPEDAVFDCTKPKMDVPWKGKISPIVTSCANLYTTEDGKDLLFELVSILSYASIFGVDVMAE